MRVALLFFCVDASARAAPVAEQGQPAQHPPAATLAPRPLASLAVSYPPGALGNAEVRLELLIGKHGGVESAVVLSGAEPFASRALLQALGFRFEPARRDGEPIAVRIRLRVSFTEPEPEPATGSEQRSKLVVTVFADRPDSSHRLGRAEVQQLPGAFGDPFRALEVLPGVTPIASGLPYFYVRGAPPGNVGYFLDDISLPTLYHAAAGPSVLHPAFIEKVALYSGGYPARYGRFAGGIVAGETARPSQQFRGELNLRLVDSGAFFEVPFADQRGSVMVGGRYSYTALLLSALLDGTELGYWDYQARVSYQLSNADQLSLFGFGAHDFLSDEDDAGFARTLLDTSFHRLQLAYEHRFQPRSALTVATTAGVERTLANENEGFTVAARSWGARADLKVGLAGGSELSMGVDTVLKRLRIGTDPDFDTELSDDDNQSFFNFDANDFRRLFPDRNESVGGAFAAWRVPVGSNLTLEPGARLDVYDSQGLMFLVFEPRLSARIRVDYAVTLVETLGLAHQAPSAPITFGGLQPSFAGGLQRQWQLSSGAEFELEQEFTLITTAFLGFLSNGTDALSVGRLDNADLSISQSEDRVTGRSYGLEIGLRRPLTEAVSGFLSYTLARSERSVRSVTGPAAFDRTHVLNLATTADLGNHYRAGVRLTTYSGIPADVGVPEAVSSPPRTPAYYRIDWRFEKRWPLASGASWAFVAEVLNTTLNREVLQSSCFAFGCRHETIGPITIPSLGVEASF